MGRSTTGLDVIPIDMVVIDWTRPFLYLLHSDITLILSKTRKPHAAQAYRDKFLECTGWDVGLTTFYPYMLPTEHMLNILN